MVGVSLRQKFTWRATANSNELRAALMAERTPKTSKHRNTTPYLRYEVMHSTAKMVGVTLRQKFTWRATAISNEFCAPH